MPVLTNPRHERFAQGVAKGRSQGEAYVYAGYSKQAAGNDTRANATRIAKRPEVAARIVELQERQANRIGVTVDDLVGELNDMLKLAKRCKQPSAGVGAVLAKGKLLGLIVDKAELDATVRKPSKVPTDKTEMTMDEWAAKFSPRSSETVQ